VDPSLVSAARNTSAVSSPGTTVRSPATTANPITADAMVMAQECQVRPVAQCQEAGTHSKPLAHRPGPPSVYWEDVSQW